VSINRPERYSKADLSKLLAEAARLQARDAGDDDSFTLAEVRDIAAEAGIGSEYIASASNALDRDLDVRRRVVCDGTSEALLQELILTVSGFPGFHGPVHDSGLGVWRWEDGAGTVIALVIGRNGVCVELRSGPFRSRRLAWCGLIATGGAAFAAAIGGFLASTVAELSIYGLGGAGIGFSAGWLLGRQVWNRMARTFRSRVHVLAGRIQDIAERHPKTME
jgi:hypothetical protein